MQKQTIIKLFAGSLLAMPLLSVAMTSPGAKLIGSLTHHELTPVKSFTAAPRLRGFVVKAQNGQEAVLFTDNKGTYLVAGNVIAKDGRNLTQYYTHKYIDSEIALKAFKAIDHTTFIADGDQGAPHKLYVVWDPNCGYCHLLYQALRPLIDKGDVQVRWIPVAIRLHSKGRVAHILDANSASEKLALIKRDEQHFNLQTEQGGIAPLKHSEKASVKRSFHVTDINTAFFQNQHFVGTPVLLYIDKSGHPQIVPGFVEGKQLKALINKTSARWQIPHHKGSQS